MGAFIVSQMAIFAKFSHPLYLTPTLIKEVSWKFAMAVGL